MQPEQIEKLYNIWIKIKNYGKDLTSGLLQMFI
jgi:hypothetical protein